MDSPRRWPVETDLHIVPGKMLKLTDQNDIMRKAITESFPVLYASIVLQHAFPDALLTNSFIRDALLAAISRFPSAGNIRARILNDHGYFAKISPLVSLTTHF